MLSLLSFLFFSLFLLFMGFHNIDNAWNLHTVNEAGNGKWFDTTFSGELMTSQDMYASGFVMMLLGSFILMISSYLAGRHESNQ